MENIETTKRTLLNLINGINGNGDKEGQVLKEEIKAMKTRQIFCKHIKHCIRCGKLDKNGNCFSLSDKSFLVLQAVICVYEEGHANLNDLVQVGIIFSSGLCKMCAREVLKETIRKKQRREGYFDCFGTAKGYCSQTNCKYYDICVVNAEEEKSHQQWLKKRFFKTLPDPSPL